MKGLGSDHAHPAKMMEFPDTLPPAKGFKSNFQTPTTEKVTPLIPAQLLQAAAGILLPGLLFNKTRAKGSPCSSQPPGGKFFKGINKTRPCSHQKVGAKKEGMGLTALESRSSGDARAEGRAQPKERQENKQS